MMKTMLLMGLCIGIVWELKHLLFGMSVSNFCQKHKEAFLTIAKKQKRQKELKAGVGKDLGSQVVLHRNPEYRGTELTPEENAINLWVFIWAGFALCHSAFEFVMLVVLASVTGYYYCWVALGFYLACLLGIPASIKKTFAMLDKKETAEMEVNYRKLSRKYTFGYFFGKLYNVLIVAVYVLVVLQYYMGIDPNIWFVANR